MADLKGPNRGPVAQVESRTPSGGVDAAESTASLPARPVGMASGKGLETNVIIGYTQMMVTFTRKDQR